MSTVFQAFFLSYLAEPGYGEKFETLQDILDSNVNYGFNAALEFAMSTMENSDHLQFPLKRRVDCADLKACLMRMLSDGDIATLSNKEYCNFISNELGYEGEMRSICYLDENFIYGSAVALFIRGNPLLNQFNKLIRRCLQGGLGLRYLAQLNHEVLLRGRTKYNEDGSSLYFVFKLSHMVPAFSVLGFG